MTAQGNVMGVRAEDGLPRRYYIDADFVHIIRTRTGKLTWCGLDAEGQIVVVLNRQFGVGGPDLPLHEHRGHVPGEHAGLPAAAQSIEGLRHVAARRKERCRTCFQAEMPQPDPAIWGPPRPPQQSPE